MTFRDPFFSRIADELAGLEEAGRFRSLSQTEGISLSGNDYLSLSRHPVLIEKTRELAGTLPSGSTGSRLLGGNHPLHEELEALICSWKNSESALLFNSGYDANTGVIQTLISKEDLVFSDKLNHACIVDGIRATGAKSERFLHQDFEDLERRLKKYTGVKANRFIIVESVYSMDGDVTDFHWLRLICEQYGCHLIVDEAHGTGVFGPTGAGILEQAGMTGYPLATIHTCGKALGTFGAFVTCRKPIRDYLVNKCRNFIFTTALPPLQAGLIAEAIRLVIPMTDDRRYLQSLAADFRQSLKTAGNWSTGKSSTMIVPVLIGPDEAAIRLAGLCRKSGFDVRAVRPPTVPEGSARLRISFTTSVTEQQASRLAGLLNSPDAMQVTPPAGH